jgi:hypothetical protein
MAFFCHKVSLGKLQNLQMSTEFTSSAKLFHHSFFFSILPSQSILPSTPEDPKKKFLYQLINREQHFISALQFGIERFVVPLKDRKDLISPNDHKVLFQNIDEVSIYSCCI